ncbi:hypothetical protein [Streptomyces sp. NBC_01006]|uniref:hypothetical protein n=1 Tax=Streptomyces sp. NBC_01006 TaxID=2903716 RepID=UPI002F914AEB|nr:hypothetical protein OG509_39895 [Streptomyces sp. NBC_01006]
MNGAEPEPPEDLQVRLRAAADRLLAGTPLHSQGKLTILDLAREAQVKRWILTHKYPIRLMAKYQAEFKAAQREPEKETAERREIDKLREALAKVREEKRKLTDLVQTYAIMIEQLATERSQALTERDEAIADRDAAFGVTALPTQPRDTRDRNASKTMRKYDPWPGPSE